MAKLTRAQELLLRAGVLTDEDVFGKTDEQVVAEWNNQQIEKENAAKALEVNRQQIADFVKTPDSMLAAGSNAVKRALYGADEDLASLGAYVQGTEADNAADEAGLVERILRNPLSSANPVSILTETLPDYLRGRLIREQVGAEGIDALRSDAAATVAESAAEKARTAEIFPMSRAAQRGLDPNETLMETLSRDGGIGDFAAGAFEVTAESLTRSLPAIGATVATRGRAAPLILAADAKMQETAAGLSSYMQQAFPDATPAQYGELLKDPEVMKAAIDFTRTRSNTVAAGAGVAGVLGSRFLPKTGATTGQVVRNAAVTQPAIGATVDSVTEAAAQLGSTGELNAKDIALEGVGGLVTQPAEVAGAYLGQRAEQRKSLEQKLADRAKADADAAAARQGTATAGSLADAFKAGVENSEPPAIPVEQTLEVDQLDVAKESFQDTRFDRATRAIDTKLEELDTAASVVDQEQPLRRQNEESKANVAEIDQLRTYVETMQQQDRPLTRDERRKTGQAIDRLNFLVAQEDGRKAIPQAKEIRSRLANAPDSELLTVAGEIDPAQNFTNLTGPDLSRLSTPQPLGKVPRAAANMPTSQETADVEKGISLAYKDMDNETKKQATAEQKQADAVSKARVEFARQYVKDNPGATPEVVREATMLWEQESGGGPSRVEGAPAAVTPPPIPQATPTGPLTREQRIANMRAMQKGDEENTQPKLAPGLETMLTSTPRRPKGDRAAMTGDPELDALLASFDANEAAATEAEATRAAAVAEDTNANDDLRTANVQSGPRGVFNKVADKAIKTGDGVVANIARRLAPLLETIGTKIEFADKSIRTENGAAAGMFIAGENKIQVAPETKSDRDRVEILAHEGLHAVMVGAYRNADQFNGGQQAKELLDSAATRLTEARQSGELQQVIAGIKNPAERARAEVLLSDADGLIFQADGTIEMDELITYANTSRPVQRVLQQIKMRPQSKKTIWSTIVDAAKALLGGNIENSVLERVMQGTDELLTAAEKDTGTLKKVVAKEQQAAVGEALANRQALSDERSAVEQFLTSGTGPIKDKLDSLVEAINDKRYVYDTGHDMWLASQKTGELWRNEGLVEKSSELTEEISSILDELSSTYNITLAGEVMSLEPNRPSRNAYKLFGRTKAEPLTAGEIADLFTSAFDRLSKEYDFAKRTNTGLFDANRMAFEQLNKSGALTGPRDRAALAAPKQDLFTRVISTSDEMVPVPARKRSRVPGAEYVRNLFQSPAARAPSAVREASSARTAATGADTAEALAVINSINKLLGERVQEFNTDVEEYNKLRDKFANTKPGDKRDAMINAMATMLDGLRQKYGEAWKRLEKARNIIDTNSRELMKLIYDAAPVDGDGKKVLDEKAIKRLNAIYANLGRYVTRQYAVNNTKQAELNRKRFEPANLTDRTRKILEDARAFLEAHDVSIGTDEQLVKKGIENLREMHELWVGPSTGLDKLDLAANLAEVRDSDQYTQERVDSLVDVAIDSILNRGTGAGRRYIRDVADDSILKERQKVPEAIRALMGETESPAIAMMYTVYKQRDLINQMKMFNELADNYDGLYVFDAAAKAPAGYVQLVGEEYARLDGKWVSPQIKELFDTKTAMTFDIEQMFVDADQTAAGIKKGLQSAASKFKAVTLLPNVGMWAFNLGGSVLTLVATGSFSAGRSMPKALKAAFAEAPGVWAKDKIPTNISELLRQGLVDSAIVGEITQTEMEYVLKQLAVNPDQANRMYSAMNALNDGRRNVIRRMFDYYAALDMWAKFQVYYSELATMQELSDAMPEGERMTPEQIKRSAAERTKAVTFSYERALPIADTAESTGLFVFSRYVSEVFRTIGNNLTMVGTDAKIASELKDAGNTEAAAVMNARVAKRAAGSAAALLGSHMVINATASIMVAMASAMGLDEEDDEELRAAIEAIHKEDASWDGTRDIRVVGSTGRGASGEPNRWVVMDMGRLDPYGPATEPWRRLWEGDFAGAGESLKNTFAGISPIIAFGGNLGDARSRNPRLLREDGFIRDAAINAGMSNNAYLKGAINFAELFLPNQVEYALTREERPLSATVGGFNQRIVDPLKFLDSPGYARRLSEQNSVIRTKMDGTDFLSNNEDAIADIVNEAMLADLKTFESVQNRVRVARAAGMSDEEIKAALLGTERDSGLGLSKQAVDSIMNGNFTPITLSEQSLSLRKRSALASATTDEERARINAAFRTLTAKQQEAVRDARRDF